MFLVLILKNIYRSLPRLLPMIAIIVAVFAALVVGNAVLAASTDALYRTYGRLVAGDLGIQAASEGNFTVFGSDQLLVGDFLIPPTISEYSELRSAVQDIPAVHAQAGLVTAVARVQIDNRTLNRTLFGVNFDEYRRLFPDLELIAGDFPAPGEPGMVVQDGWGAGTGSSDGMLGEPALLASARDNSFSLREVPVTGVFRYPVEDELLDTVVLVDADTARAMNGYLYGAVESVELSDDERNALEDDVDALFGSPPAGSGGAEEAGTVDIGALFGGGEPDSDAGAANSAGTVDTGAWNFLLLSLRDSERRGEVEDRLEEAGFTVDGGYRIREWWHTVGGNALILRYLQLIFNAGVVFVAVGAGAIAANALVLSVLERTSEIGTFRALGATRLRIAAMITTETFIIVTGAAAIGLFLGVSGVNFLNDAGFTVSNQYIRILFGGGAVRGLVDGELIRNHVIAAMVLTAFALFYPLKRALWINPREAIES